MIEPVQRGSRLAHLLLAAFHESVVAPDAETGAARVAELSGQTKDAGAWLEVTAEAVGKGLVRDPVRLPQGALQCHWHLELTPAGVEVARQLESDRQRIA